ncbi:acetyl-CoA hydrolase/transferase family protein [Pseudorhodoferax sp.]|uniref:acetyl-CoA hydrolase/transferase family protein n=1 Tax=Pseudorhodoferax sp. TaxID=1993553 RepID=UPI002DD627C5|nr:acetyl-CoA hydrolase/transferase C-terminal domain-containing protein [Pseudorhodoferax sp.]
MIELHDPRALDLSRWIGPGDTLVCSQIHAEPVTLMRLLAQQRAQLGPVSVFVGPLVAETFTPAHGDHIGLRSYCGTGRNAALADAGMLDPVPTHYSEYARLYADGLVPCDVVLLGVTEADADGRFNLGPCNDYTVDAARRARVVIAEVLPGLPWVRGAELPSDIAPQVLLRANAPASLLPETGPGSAEEQAIARHVASIVPDRATLALGIGAMPNLVLRALAGHRGLGIHSGAIGDAMVELVQAGVITNEGKPEFQGVSVGNLLMGSRRLLDFADRNPQLRLEPTRFTHDITSMRRIPRFYAASSCVEMDLSGQVNAEVAGGRYIGAVGGQGDFLRGANLSPGGGSVMMLSSTARGGRSSRIVARLADAVVTTPRSDVQWVVTEHGVADLRGKSLRQRMQALLPLAHPAFREALEREARRSAAP